MTKDLEVCPGCGAETVVALGIGPYCPNEKCPRSDDLRPESEYQKGPAIPNIARPSNPIDERWYDGASVTKAELAVALGKQRAEIERLQRELATEASIRAEFENKADRLEHALAAVRSAINRPDFGQMHAHETTEYTKGQPPSFEAGDEPSGEALRCTVETNAPTQPPPLGGLTSSLQEGCGSPVETDDAPKAG